MPKSLDQPPRYTVLVVEDETPVRLALAEYLRSSGLRVLEAESGAEAVSLLSGDVAVDVVCSHIQMPGEPDGFLLARWVRSTRPEARTLLTSGYTDQTNAVQPAGHMPVESGGSYESILQHIQQLLAETVNLSTPRPNTDAT